MKNNNKGFTLMEMLIVVAIIAILIAIAIPTFSGSLEKARLAADEANVRAAYSEAMSDFLTKQVDTADPSASKSTKNNMQTTCSSGKVGDVDVAIGDITAANINWAKGSPATVTVSSTNGVTSVTVTGGAAPAPSTPPQG